jgi:hypothetical protein
MSVRIVSITGNTGLSSLKTVNVVTSGPTGSAGNQFKSQVQVTGNTGQNAGETPTYYVAPTGTKGIPTILIPGFVGPA